MAAKDVDVIPPTSTSTLVPASGLASIGPTLASTSEANSVPHPDKATTPSAVGTGEGSGSFFLDFPPQPDSRDGPKVVADIIYVTGTRAIGH